MRESTKHLLLILAVLLFAVFTTWLLTNPAGALTSPECPNGHDATLFNYPGGGYHYVYSPNEPGGYSRLIIIPDTGPPTRIEMPPIGTFGPGAQFILCYTNDIYGYVEYIGWQGRCEGFSTVDGCLTLDEYDEMFSFEALQQVESLTMPGRSVADIYHVPSSPRASDRPRLGGYPTIREVVEGRLWAL